MRLACTARDEAKKTSEGPERQAKVALYSVGKATAGDCVCVTEI